jgi:hypothetical protein
MTRIYGRFDCGRSRCCSSVKRKYAVDPYCILWEGQQRAFEDVDTQRLLCGMFVLASATFSGALIHCSGVGMQMCSSKQLELLASSGYCNCYRTWALEGSLMQPQPHLSECRQCIKCGKFRKNWFLLLHFNCIFWYKYGQGQRRNRMLQTNLQ